MAPFRAERSKRAEARQALSEFNYSPREIVAKLDEYVIGQERAKRDVAVGLYDHHRIHQGDIAQQKPEPKLRSSWKKPTSCWSALPAAARLLLARTLARSLGVPFASADATSLSPTGYTGNDVESILTAAYIDAGEDLEWAGRSVIFIDEIDKIARKSQANPEHHPRRVRRIGSARASEARRRHDGPASAGRLGPQASRRPAGVY